MLRRTDVGLPSRKTGAPPGQTLASTITRGQSLAVFQPVQKRCWSLPSTRPVERDHANEDERHPNFRFDVRQVVRNPPWSAGVPINKRGIADGREIPVKPEGHAD